MNACRRRLSSIMAAVGPPFSSGLHAVSSSGPLSPPADTPLLSSSPSHADTFLDLSASPVSENREFVTRDTPNHTEFTSPHRPLSVSKSSPVAAHRIPQLSHPSYPPLSPPNIKPLLSPPRRVLIATTKASSPGTSKYFHSSVIHRADSPVTHQPLISPQKTGVSFSSSSPALHRPLIAQRSSPALHRSTVVRTPVATPPKSPLLFRSSRKLSCPRVTRISPTQFKYSFQYSKVPKSDSAYSEEPYSYSPVPSSYSPSSDYPYTCRDITKSETTYSDLNYSYSACIPKSDSAYSEQYTNSSLRPKSSFPKSRSTIFRSDSAFSDIEYSYSTIPQSESYYQDKNCSYSSLPKSDSVYSENILSTSNCNRSNFIPRSFSAHNPHLECETENVPPASYKASPSLVHSASQAHIPTTTQFIFPKSHSSYFCSTSPTSLIMPTLKSFLKPPSRQPIPSRPSQYDRHPKRSDVSVHSLKLISSGSSHEPSIKKSHTVLALSSNLSFNGAASTKLLSKEAPHTCIISGCLTKSLKQSLSQTLNQSIGHNLNISAGGADTNPQRKRSRRRSNISAFIPRSFSRSSSIAPSVTSGGGSYVGSCGGGEGDTLYCRLCLMDVSVNMMCQLTVCQCRFCRYCLTEYTRVRIEEGEYRVECPDASCEGGEGGRTVGELTSEEIGALVGRDMLLVRNRIKLSSEVAADPYRAWCPKPGCETIVHLSKSKFVSNVSGGPSTRTSSSKPPSTLTVSTLPPTTIFSTTSVTSKSFTTATTATTSVPFLPSAPAKKTRTRRFGTTVNVYAKGNEKENPVPSSPNIEQTLLEVDESMSVDITLNLTSARGDNSSPVDGVNTSLDVNSSTNSSLGDSVIISCTNADLTNGNNNNNDNNNRAGFRTSVVGSVQIVDSNMANIGHIDIKSEAPRGTFYASPEKRKESFDDVNMIKYIGPSSPPSVPRPRPSGLDDFPADPNLSATLAGLQSPADYRPFATLAGLQSPADYRPFASLSEAGSLRVLPGVPELSEGSGDWACCPTCRSVFCPRCSRLGGHASNECPAPTNEQTRGLRRHYKKLVGDVDDFQGQIKSCPNLKCQVYIERNEGCAQMQCRACKHTFCWYCRASLEEDFLLRHYDSGPCRNKLGHSRASVLCHRLQVLAIFLGVGLLVLAASPLLLVVGPCMLCCKCRPDTRGASSEDNDA